MAKLAAALVACALSASPAAAQVQWRGSPPSAGPPARAVSDTAAPTLPSVASLFRDLGRDFERLPSWETAAVLGVAGGVSAGVSHRDVELSRQAVASPMMDRLFEPGEVVGGGAIQVGGAFAAYAFGRAMRSPRIAGLGADLVRAQLVNAVLTQGIKLSVARRRPDQGRYSFPSGHTSATFATAAVLQRHYGWKVAVPAYGMAAFVAGSRVQENRHFLSDVIFGAAVGVVAGRTVGVGHGRGRFALAPFAADGGGGIGLTLIGGQ